jgi:hypothetical protein
MGDACSVCGRDKKYKVLSENLKGRDHLEVSGMNGRNQKIREIEYECVDWIHLVQDKILWQAFLNTGINHLVP